jgi:SAM-dependent methyltransferase
MASTRALTLSPGSAETEWSASLEPWARMLVDAAGIDPGDRVLVVACGTGIVARAAADRTGAAGSVVGLDRDPAMLAVAEGLRPDLEWREGDAMGLPFLARSFDVVLCQAALMSFSDTGRALREMARAIKDDGTVAIQVWDRMDAQSDLPALQALLPAAGLWPVVTRTRSIDLRAFTSADGALDIPIRGHVIAATLRARHVGSRHVHAGIGT